MSADAGRYDRSDVNESLTDPRLPATSVEFEDKALHAWLGSGVRFLILAP